MQYHDVSKTVGRFKTSFLDPLKIAQETFTYKPTAEEKAKLSAEEQLSKKKTKEDEKKIEITDYITRVFLISQDKIDMCSLLFCVSSISSINLKSLFCSIVDKEPNVTLYTVTTTCASIFTSRTGEYWCLTQPIFKSPDTKNSPT